MGKSLVIVESPAKAKTINKYLGKDFVVKSSIGHIRDLPTSGAGRDGAGKTPNKAPKDAGKSTRAFFSLVRRMGVDPEHGWKAHYEVLPGKEKVLEELQKLAEDADRVYLATDLDREGEAIAWHLREVIGGDPERFKRVTFSEITKNAIQAAFEQPGELNMDRVNAQQARRFLDRVVGFMLSPLLWKKVARGLSAGRVQSVATRLVVEREREIKAFVPEEYWELHADLADRAGAELRAQVVKQAGESFRPGSQAEMDRVLAALQPADYRIVSREDKPSRSKPPAPFITSSLQQAASVRLGFSVKKTMTLAQRLYEAGFITYMRTDSRNLSQDAITSVRGFIQKQYGERYLPEQPNLYASGSGAQEAHEAIRPTDVRLEADDLEGKVEPDQKRLYDLIWRQFVGCQMPPAEYDTTALTIQALDFELRARGRVLRFDGFLKVLPPMGKRGEEDTVLPDLQEGTELALQQLEPSQHFTKPPARFTEASLVRELEKRSIGRPSTYASIISTIQDRGYVRLENRRMYAEKMGEIVTDRLVESFDRIMDYGFTAELEEELDKVAGGELVWKSVLDEFYRRFMLKLQAAEEAMRGNQPVELPEIPCPDCGRPMAIRTARTGVFLSCTGYALSKKEGKCSKTINLVPGEQSEAVGDDDELAEVNALREKRRCPECGTAMDSWLIDEQRRLHICGNNPDCPGHEVEHGQFKIKGYEGPLIECDKCGADMQLRSGRFGKYFACTADDCKNTRKLLRSGQPAPPKIDPVHMPELKCTKADDHFVLRDGAAGLFLAAASYPRVRETRNPLVRELKPHAQELPDKYRYMADAPEIDSEGNPMVVRYSKKTLSHYVAGDKDGKPSGQAAFYENGKWVLGADKKDAPKKKAAAKKQTAAAKKQPAAKKKD